MDVEAHLDEALVVVEGERVREPLQVLNLLHRQHEARGILAALEPSELEQVDHVAEPIVGADIFMDEGLPSVPIGAVNTLCHLFLQLFQEC